MDLADSFRTQARACAELGSPMYAELLAGLAPHAEHGGVVREVLAGHENDPGPSALALRLLGSVHRLVLSRRADDLALYYPSVGGTWDREAGVAAFVALCERQPDAVREWVDRVPQTNEIGRATVLYGGLLQLPVRLPVRLFEMGASAGLNLRPDHVACWDDRGRRLGRPDAAIEIPDAYRGRALDDWPDLRVVERVGCDLEPLDATSTEGRLALTAYVWPDQRVRLERLRAALRLASRVPAEVRRQSAAEFVEDLELREGATTVLWHSVMWQYLGEDEQRSVEAAIGRLGRSAAEERPFAHLRLEQLRRRTGAPHEFLVLLTTWPGGRERLIGTSAGHGVPTHWE